MQGVQDAQVAGKFTTVNSLKATSVICVTLLQASPVVSPSFHFSLFQNEASILWFYAATQGVCFVPNMSLLSPSLAFILVFSTLLLALTPPQLYMHDALYHHLVHIGDCHCHLLIITVTCTLRSAINTWRYQWRAAAPQRLFRPPQSWWERESWQQRERRESLNATHKGFIAV